MVGGLYLLLICRMMRWMMRWMIGLCLMTWLVCWAVEWKYNNFRFKFMDTN